MRNWNQESSQPERRLWKVFSLPMRNWNILSLPALLRWMTFSAYLWGIETWWQGATRRDTWPGFQPTYEELKLLTMKETAWCALKFSAYLVI